MKTTRRRTIKACAVALALLGSLTARPIGAGELTATLDRLREVVDAIEALRDDQRKAWPTRHEDQLLERRGPPAFRELERAQKELQQERRILLLRLSIQTRVDDSRRLTPQDEGVDIGPLLTALGSNNVPYLDAILPIIAELAPHHLELVPALLKATQRFETPPRSFVRALAATHDESAGLFLLDLGLATGDTALLEAAGDNGARAVVIRLVDLARRRGPLRPVILDVIRRLDPRGTDRVLETHLVEAIEAQGDEELRSALVAYLGSFRNDSYRKLFESLYHTAKSDNVRKAAIGALGNCGESAARFLVQALAAGAPRDVELCLVHALGSTGSRMAVPALIDLLGELELKTRAQRALERISGKRLGSQAGRWTRWWRRQPEAARFAGDPDLDSLLAPDVDASQTSSPEEGAADETGAETTGSE